MCHQSRMIGKTKVRHMDATRQCMGHRVATQPISIYVVCEKEDVFSRWKAKSRYNVLTRILLKINKGTSIMLPTKTMICDSYGIRICYSYMNVNMWFLRECKYVILTQMWICDSDGNVNMWLLWKCKYVIHTRMWIHDSYENVNM